MLRMVLVLSDWSSFEGLSFWEDRGGRGVRLFQDHLSDNAAWLTVPSVVLVIVFGAVNLRYVPFSLVLHNAFTNPIIERLW